MDAAARRLLLGLNAWPGFGPRRIAAWLRGEPFAAGPALPAEQELERLGAGQEAACAAAGARALLAGDPEWPATLAALDHPPPVLFVRGDAAALSDRCRRVALVGARACTPYGREQAARFGAGFAAAGATVVSGAARGIDQHGMAGALAAEGRVLAVLGSGLDVPYPPGSEPLLEATVAAGGAVVSEFGFGAGPRAGNFPRRNRVLAGLCEAVVVVQATRRSGTMNTAAWALSLGREVWAVPGPVDSPASQGVHLLLREGAGLADGPAEVLRGLDRAASPEEMGKVSPELEALAGGDLGLAGIAAATGRGEEETLLELLDLELRGLAVRLPSGLYHRCGPRPR